VIQWRGIHETQTPYPTKKESPTQHINTANWMKHNHEVSFKQSKKKNNMKTENDAHVHMILQYDNRKGKG
jgi:hypothetical protein